MTLILSGTDGLSDVDGSAATPAIRGTDANTGIFFPAADTIAFSEGGVEAARFDSSGNLGIGTSSPAVPLDVVANSSALNLRLRGRSADSIGQMEFWNNASSTRYGYIGSESTNITLATSGALPLIFVTNGSERVRIDSSGLLLVNTTSQTFNSRFCVNTALNGGSFQTTAGASSYSAIVGARSGNIGNVAEWWYSSATQVGTISITSSTTAYNTSSDYRLKNTIFPMTGALAKVALLKPVTYKWNIDDSDGEGFIAHELAEVIPHAVTGEKDAVDEEGNPKYQGIDTSFLVATLTAAIQEQQAIIESLKARLDAANL